MRKTVAAALGAVFLVGSLGSSTAAAADEAEFVNPAESCRPAGDVGRLFGTCVGGLASSTRPGKSRHDTR